jgi:hypothetical protein
MISLKDMLMYLKNPIGNVSHIFNLWASLLAGFMQPLVSDMIQSRNHRVIRTLEPAARAKHSRRSSRNRNGIT